MINRIFQWLKTHRLVWCLRCRKLIFIKDARREWTTSGLVATLCENCHAELFHPWKGV